MELKVTTNTDEVKRILASVPKKIATPSLVQALNTAGRDGKSSAIKKAARVTGVKQKEIRKRITGVKGNARANRKRLSAMIFIRTSYGVPLAKAVNKGTFKKVATRSSFQATMPNGKFGIFERTGKTKRPTRKGSYYGRIATRGPNRGKLIKREPIQEVRLPLHPLGTNAAKSAFTARARDTLPRELKRQIERRINAQKNRN